MAAPPHDLPLVVPLRPGPVLCVLLVPALPLLAILLSNALTFSRTCPSLRLLALPWPSLLPLSPCLRFLSLFAALPLPLLSLLPLLLLPEVVQRTSGNKKVLNKKLEAASANSIRNRVGCRPAQLIV